MADGLSRSDVERIVYDEIGKASKYLEAAMRKYAEQVQGELEQVRKMREDKLVQLMSGAQEEVRSAAESIALATIQDEETQKKIESSARNSLNNSIKALTPSITESEIRKYVINLMPSVMENASKKLREDMQAWVKLAGPTIAQEEVTKHVKKALENEKNSPVRILRSVRRNRYVGVAIGLAVVGAMAFFSWDTSRKTKQLQKSDTGQMREDLDFYRRESSERIRLLSGSLEIVTENLDKRLTERANDGETALKGLAAEVAGLKTNTTSYKVDIDGLRQLNVTISAEQKALREYINSVAGGVSALKETYDKFEKGAARKEEFEKAYAEANAGLKGLADRLDAYDRVVVKLTDYKSARESDRREYIKLLEKNAKDIDDVRKAMLEMGKIEEKNRKKSPESETKN